MKVLQRWQITEVITKRSVSHDVLLNGVKYSRHMSIKISLPYMDCNVHVSEPEIKWREYVEPRVLKTLTRKEANVLKLEQQFQALSKHEINGNAIQD